MRLVKLSGTNMEITPAIRAYVEERLVIGVSKFTTHLDANGTELSVDCGRTSNHHKQGDVHHCEATLAIPGKHMFRAESTQNDLYAAVDAVKDELCRQVKDYEKKSRTKDRRGGALLKKLRSYIPFINTEDDTTEGGM